MNEYLASITLNNGSVIGVKFQAIASADLPATITQNLTLSGSTGMGNSGAPNDGSLLGGSGFLTGISCENTWTNLTNPTGEECGICCLSLVKPSGAVGASNIVVNIESEIATDPSMTANLLALYSGSFISAHQGSGTLADLKAILAEGENDGAGTLTSLIGIEAGVSNGGSGSVVQGYGVFIDSAFNSGTWTANYGLWIGDQSAVASSNWNLWSDGGGANYFGGQVGLGAATPNAAAKLQVDSTTQGVLLPRLTTAQKNAIASPPEGLIVYDLTLHTISFWNGTAWTPV